MPLLRICLCSTILLWFLLVGKVLGQTQHIHPHPVLNAIDKAYEQKQISLDERVLFKFYALRSPNKLPAKLKPKDGEPVKCGTPAFADYYQRKSQLSLATINEIEGMTSQGQASETFSSSSGNFLIHYETTGGDAVPPEDTSGVNGVPDYVEFVAAAADSSWRYQVQELGFTDPILQSSQYDITIRDLGDGFYGLTRVNGNTTEIEIHNDFLNGFPPNDHPNGDQIGAINVTMAHEFKHAVQYANNQWQGSAGSFGWIEMDATLMEEMTYDNVNDYYNYITSTQSIFLNPGDPIPGAYWDVSFSIFFDEVFGSGFWVDVWQQEIKPNPTMDFLDAIKNQLDIRGQSFNKMFAQSYLWHYASGPDFSGPNYGFEERANYPNPNTSNTIQDTSNTFTNTLSLTPQSANFYLIDLESNRNGNMSILFDSVSTQSISVGLVVYLKNGGFEVRSLSIDQNKITNYQSPWSWNEIDQVGVVFSNSKDSSIPYRFKVASSENVPPETINDKFTNKQTIAGLTSDHYVFSPTPDLTGNIAFSIFSESTSLGLEFRFDLKSGGEEIQNRASTINEVSEFKFAKKWEDINQLEVTVSNNEITESEYRYRIFSTIPQKILMPQNYPNPFNPTTTIRFRLSNTTNVQLRVYDITGRLVRTIIDDRLNFGFYEIPFDGSNLASGIYIYRLVTDEKVLTRKMTLIK